VREAPATTWQVASLDKLGSVTGDSSAEAQAEESGQTATAPPEAATSAQPEAGVPEGVVGEDAAREDAEREDAARDAAPGESDGPADSNGNAGANRHGEANDHGETNGNAHPPAPATDRPPLTITPDVEKPAFGPRILGIAEPVKPLPPSKPAPVRKRRRRPSAGERHRRAFFSALTELRRSGKAPSEAVPAGESSAAEAQSAPAAEALSASAADTGSAPAAETPRVEVAPVVAEVAPPVPESPAAHPPEVPVAQAPEATVAQAPAASEAQADSSSSDSPAHLTAAIERVGGEEVIKEALKPKQDEKGQPLKWAAVCAQAAEGLKPGDPVFNAWVRLAATPVREVKAHLPRPAEQARPAGREGGRRNGGQRSSEGGRRDRPRRDDRASRQSFASHAQDGTLRKSIRIVTGHDEDRERRERERVRKEQREAKRQAERERLARLGY